MPKEEKAVYDYDRTKIPIPKTTYEVAKKMCLDCVGGERWRVKDCPFADCLFWPHRFGVRPTTARAKAYQVGKSTKSLLKTDIRNHCHWCLGGGARAYIDIEKCKDIDCGCHPFRMIGA